MAARRPLVVVSGAVQELPAGDTVIGASGGGGGGTRGKTTVDFGAVGGYATTVVTGQAGILAGSVVRAWVQADATADHSVDEHGIACLSVVAGSIVPGTGFTIFAVANGVTRGLWTIARERV